MRSPLLDHDLLRSQLEQLIADKFQFSAIEMARITPDEPLVGGRLGFDDLDALELGMYVEEAFAITLDGTAESRMALTSIGSLADFIRRYAPTHEVAGPIEQPSPWPAWSAHPATVLSDALRLLAGV